MVVAGERHCRGHITTIRCLVDILLDVIEISNRLEIDILKIGELRVRRPLAIRAHDANIERVTGRNLSRPFEVRRQTEIVQKVRRIQRDVRADNLAQIIPIQHQLHGKAGGHTIDYCRNQEDRQQPRGQRMRDRPIIRPRPPRRRTCNPCPTPS